MKGNYFYEDVYYFTKNGFKLANELSDTDELYYIDDKGYLKTCSNFKVSSTQSHVCYRHWYGAFNTIDSLQENELSIKPSIYNDFTIPSDLPDSIYYTFTYNHKKYRKSLESCMALSYFISNYFNENLSSLNKISQKNMVYLVKNIFNSEGIYVKFDKETSKYIINETSIHKSFDEYHELLLNNIESFRKIFNKFKEYNLIFGKDMSVLYVNNYRVARLFQALLYLIEYKSYLKFDKTTKYFKINLVNSIDEKFNKTMINKKLYSKNLLTFYRVSSETKGRFIVSQNIDKKTTINLIEISNEDFI